MDIDKRIIERLESDLSIDPIDTKIKFCLFLIHPQIFSFLFSIKSLELGIIMLEKIGF